MKKIGWAHSFKEPEIIAPSFKVTISDKYSEVFELAVKQFMQAYNIPMSNIGRFSSNQYPNHTDLLFDCKVFGTIKNIKGYENDDFIKNRITFGCQFTPNSEYFFFIND